MSPGHLTVESTVLDLTGQKFHEGLVVERGKSDGFNFLSVIFLLVCSTLAISKIVQATGSTHDLGM